MLIPCLEPIPPPKIAFIPTGAGPQDAGEDADGEGDAQLGADADADANMCVASIRPMYIPLGLSFVHNRAQGRGL